MLLDEIFTDFKTPVEMLNFHESAFTTKNYVVTKSLLESKFSFWWKKWTAREIKISCSDETSFIMKL